MKREPIVIQIDKYNTYVTVEFPKNDNEQLKVTYLPGVNYTEEDIMRELNIVLEKINNRDKSVNIEQETVSNFDDLDETLKARIMELHGQLNIKESNT